MTDTEITALVEWAEATVGDPTADDGCRVCGYPPCDDIHMTLPHRHAYVDPRPIAMLAVIGRQLLDERDALKRDYEVLAMQLRLRTEALAEQLDPACYLPAND